MNELRHTMQYRRIKEVTQFSFFFFFQSKGMDLFTNIRCITYAFVWRNEGGKNYNYILIVHT